MNPFSVIIPTSGRSDVLRKVLDSIQNQFNELVQEIIVVFDAAHADGEIATKYAQVRILTTGARKGPAGARNLGASRAVAEHLVFIDDDVIPAEKALSRLAEFVQREPAVAWVCRIVPDSTVPDNAYVRFAYAGVAHSGAWGGAWDSFWHYCTSFALVPRESFLSIHGFDEQFDRPGYEDVELAYRLFRAHVSIQPCPDVMGRHLKKMDRKWFIERCEIHGRLLKKLLTMQPGTRNRRHEWLDRMSPLQPLLAKTWRVGKRILPALEKLPAGLVQAPLRLLHTVGLAASYLAARE
jgi:GT2 family glycosyltransferase